MDRSNIEKIAKITGLDIRKFEDAITMKIVLTLNNIKVLKKSVYSLLLKN